LLRLEPGVLEQGVVVGRVLPHEVGREIVIGIDGKGELAQPEPAAGRLHAFGGQPPAGLVHELTGRGARPGHGLEQGDVADVVTPVVEIALIDGGDTPGHDLAVLPGHEGTDGAAVGEGTGAEQHRQLQGLHGGPADRPLLVDAVVELHELGQCLLAAQLFDVDAHNRVLHPGRARPYRAGPSTPSNRARVTAPDPRHSPHTAAIHATAPSAMAVEPAPSRTPLDWASATMIKGSVTSPDAC